MKKLLLNFSILWNNLFRGLKVADEIISTNRSEGSSSVSNEVVNEDDGGLAGALLRGEVTEEVKELRHRVYKVDRNADRFSYISPTLSKERTDEDFWKSNVSVANSEGNEIILIQENRIKKLNAKESFEKFGEGDITLDVLQKYNRDMIFVYDGFNPDMNISLYTNRLVYRSNELGYFIDLYISKYEDKSDIMNRRLIKLLSSMDNTIIGSKGFTQIEHIEFMTIGAYKKQNGFFMSFGGFEYDSISEFDGNFVLTFKVDPEQTKSIDLYEQYFHDGVEKKYEIKAEREDRTFDPLRTDKSISYTCEECGYTVGKNEDVIVEDGFDETVVESVEYIDFLIAKQTYGKYLCQNCLGKILVGE